MQSVPRYWEVAPALQGSARPLSGLTTRLLRRCMSDRAKTSTLNPVCWARPRKLRSAASRPHGLLQKGMASFKHSRILSGVRTDLREVGSVFKSRLGGACGPIFLAKKSQATSSRQACRLAASFSHEGLESRQRLQDPLQHELVKVAVLAS